MRFVWALVCLSVVMPALVEADAPLPKNNPLAEYDLAWTERIAWDEVVNIHDFDGADWHARLDAAQDALMERGGGVVYFPAGVYRFEADIALGDGIVLRGETPALRAKDDGFALRTRIVFPTYQPTFTGEGTPVETAFKHITLKDAARASQCGLAFLSIEFGAVYFPEGAGHEVGRDRFVYGCRLVAAARAIPSVPQDWQHAWQRFTHRHRAAIQVYTQENALVANNRLANSQAHNFTMPGYRIKNRQGEIVEQDQITFDYDNRPGIVVNGFAIGAAGGNPPDGTPDTHPHGFREGIEIRDNRIFSTGGYGILFTGLGTLCADNVIRFAPNVRRYTVTGEQYSSGSSTNGNRAVEMRGWGYTVAGNDYEVYSNIAADGNYRINDGEGLMHEDHVNSIVKDSQIVNNTGNTYISIYKTGGIDGLLVKGNRIDSRIFVVANRNSGPHACRNVRIVENTTPRIQIAGDPAENNLLRDNRNPLEELGGIVNHAAAAAQGNEGYQVVSGR